ncbi:Ubiquinone biosynthesis protein Coq4 [Legionella jamestowniensis DSM 19215]|uniref:Coenzyme Q (Ubiquinone) biosynthesis protein Coq4 n=2 Tax=Legionella jamestowniensis TaxID=455 RepID=A0A0W0UHN7_9GAMM|nr:Coenzyme Q (ubiquinone) biosynthesis protein Coq4 [Legionella jamestowniensis]SFL93810.1 Ubiquinone biosynthesis protein Coq4 [Legionella jamestowniensis DSM 19215]
MRHYRRAIKKLRIRLISIKLIYQLYGFFGLFRFITHDHKSLKNVNRMYFLTHLNKDYSKNMVSELLKNNEIKSTIDKRVLSNPDLEKFEKLPQDTLGFQYYKFLRENEIKPFVFASPYYKMCGIYNYVCIRMIETHDIYHVILGADTDFIGEAIVASFTIAQLPTYLPPGVHIAAGMLSVAIDGTIPLDKSIEAILLGYAQGKKAKLLFTIDWSGLWETNLEQIRKDLNIDVNRGNNGLQLQ